MNIKSLIRTVPHFPKDGIMFRDITSLLKDPKGFKEMIELFVRRYENVEFDIVAGIESRGFILGSALAHRLEKGFVPIRKKGKLPGETISKEYNLEYGTDILELHTDAFKKGARVLIIDDLMATGGTAMGAVGLVNDLGGEVVEFAVAIDLPELGGSKVLAKESISFFRLMEFDGH